MSTAPASQKIIVVDFGAQYGQLIARRVRDLHVYSEIVPCDVSADEVRALAPAAIILSGGPASVYADDAPSLDPEVFELGIPVLGFCYGQQIMAVTLGGTVGHTDELASTAGALTAGGAAHVGALPCCTAEHAGRADRVDEPPRRRGRGAGGLRGDGLAPTRAPWRPWNAPSGELYATQFHPEVRHTAVRRRAAAQLPVRRVRT